MTWSHMGQMGHPGRQSRRSRAAGCARSLQDPENIDEQDRSHKECPQLLGFPEKEESMSVIL